MKAGAAQALERELRNVNRAAGYHGSLVCTEDGLLVASDGHWSSDETVAGFASLFDDVVTRAVRDLSCRRVDELTLLDEAVGRFVVRPISNISNPRMMLVVLMPPDATWRRNTNTLASRIERLLGEPAPAGAEEVH